MHHPAIQGANRINWPGAQVKHQPLPGCTTIANPTPLGATYLDASLVGACLDPPSTTIDQTYLQFHYLGTGFVPETVLNNFGFGVVPSAWFNQLVVSSSSQLKLGPSTTPTTCTGTAG